MIGPAIGRNRYCGPGAFAILTGSTTDDGAAMIRRVNGKRAVFGTSPEDLTLALCYAGWLAFPQEIPRRQSLERLAPDFFGNGAAYLVEITGHWCVVQGNQVCDNHTIYPLAIYRYRQRGKHVKRAWRVVRDLSYNERHRANL